MARRRLLNDHPWCDADIQGVAAARLGGKQKRRAAVIVMGMSRSGTSLTTSIITKLLNPGGGDEKTVYMGSGAPYPADHANPNGYYERRDVISLDYGTLRTIEKGAWYNFPPGFAQHPTLLNYSGSPSLAAHQRRTFEEKAVPILADMDKRQPWVLKDVRFARMLPLWWPLLTAGAVCVIPYRNPLDVAASSILHSTRVWENYMSAALATTAALCAGWALTAAAFDSAAPGAAELPATLARRSRSHLAWRSSLCRSHLLGHGTRRGRRRRRRRRRRRHLRVARWRAAAA